MKTVFACPQCDYPSRMPLPGSSKCSSCGHETCVADADPQLPACPICGNDELYRKKDFPHWLGMGILLVACIGFLIGHGLYYPNVAWAILIGSAILDGLLYKFVGDAIVCYRCHAHVRGVPNTERFAPHELGISERYRQERIRKELVEKEKAESS